MPSGLRADYFPNVHTNIHTYIYICSCVQKHVSGISLVAVNVRRFNEEENEARLANSVTETEIRFVGFRNGKNKIQPKWKRNIRSSHGLFDSTIELFDKVSLSCYVIIHWVIIFKWYIYKENAKKKRKYTSKSSKDSIEIK